MSEQDQMSCVGEMLVSRKRARQEYACWQEKLTRWGQVLHPLTVAMSAHPTDPRRDYTSLLDDYPSKEDVLEAFQKIHELHQEIERLTDQLKDFE